MKISWPQRNLKKKRQTSTFYTPPSLVELILNEKLPVNKMQKKYKVKILDPTCGSAIFLVESFRRLIKRYENSTGNKLTKYKTLKNILLGNIYGIDTNLNSLKIAAFSLYLALLENLEPKTLWQKRSVPYLINSTELPPEKQGRNLYHRDSIIENKELERIEFELVIGNPPFGTKELPQSIVDYCKKENFAMEQVLPFLHKAVRFSPKGDIALIFNIKILTNNKSRYANFRKWLFSCYVEKIYNFSILRKAPENYGGKLFNSSDSSICIIFYKRIPPKNPLKKIVYYAPKTFIKTNILDGIVIDNTYVKYLPRDECKYPDTKIWKTAMWGGGCDIDLIKKIQSNGDFPVEKFTNKFSIGAGVGFQLFTHNEEKRKQYQSDILSDMRYLDADCITRYYTSNNALRNVTEALKRDKSKLFYMKLYNTQDVSQIKKIDLFRTLGDMKAYKPPHIVVKKGLENNKICASFIDSDCSFRDGVYGFYSDDSDALKALMAYFNSKLSFYYLFMTNSSFGIEREQIMKEEFLSIPIMLNEKEIKEISVLISDFLQKAKQEIPFTTTELPHEINMKIENIIYNSFGLTEKEKIILNDTIENSIDLFLMRDKSNALRPIYNVQPYAKMMCCELNDFLEMQNLYVNATAYSLNQYTPLIMLKLSFSEIKRKILYLQKT